MGFEVSGNKVNGMYQIETVKDSILNGGAFGTEGGVVVTAITILTILFVYLYYKDRSMDIFLESNI